MIYNKEGRLVFRLNSTDYGFAFTSGRKREGVGERKKTVFCFFVFFVWGGGGGGEGLSLYESKSL